MTYEESLHEINTMVYRNTDDFSMTISKECYKMITEALEKQIPKPLKSKYRKSPTEDMAYFTARTQDFARYAETQVPIHTAEPADNGSIGVISHDPLP